MSLKIVTEVSLKTVCTISGCLTMHTAITIGYFDNFNFFRSLYVLSVVLNLDWYIIVL